jgi:two-component system sensor histidine kinase/response regulator
MTNLPKILIVDDLPVNLLALRKLLSIHEAEIIEAKDGNEALALCLDNEFALALLDVNMPGMDGYELAAFMRDEPRTAEIPIIFVTAAYKDDSHRIRGYGVGAVDYIEKPIDDRILNSKVRVFIDLYRKKQELAAALEEMQQTEALLTARTNELARSNSELEQFAYVASHDLRQPLRMVSSYLALIERKLGKDLDEDTKDFLGFAIDGAKQMDALILGLLEFSRVGRSKQPFSKLSLAEIMENAVHTFATVIEDAKAKVNVAADLPEVMGAPMELLRLFDNLIGNALKYRLPERNQVIDIGWRSEGANNVIWVKDNGIGMESKDCERVFAMFQRLVTREQYEGTGIGLAVSRKIVERHGGRIWAESALGEGSCFFIALPKV